MGKGLDIDVLRTFHAVATLGRFKEAAAHVHRSASAVTTQVQKLEEQIGQQLFVRNNRVVELTQAGRHLLAEVNHFLLVHDRLLTTFSPDRLTGKLRLGLPEGYAAEFISEFLPIVVASHPRLELEVEARSSGELVELFTRRRLDLTLAVSPMALDQGERIGSTQPKWIAAQGFSPDSAVPLPIALQLKGCPHRENAIAILKARGIPFRIILQSTNWEAVAACIRSGLAVGVGESLDSQDSATQYRQYMALPALAEHGVYLLADASHHAACQLRDVFKATFQITDRRLPARGGSRLQMRGGEM